MVTFYNITLSTAFSLLMLSVAEATRPNVVLINADDLGWAEVGCYGQKKIKTPNIDKLASEGQRWVYFYSGAPVCSPSRNVLMTGKHTGNCDVQDLKRVDAGENWRDLKGDWPIRTETYTLPEAMKKPVTPQRCSVNGVLGISVPPERRTNTAWTGSMATRTRKPATPTILHTSGMTERRKFSTLP